MARKRKTLPNDFEELLKSGDLEALKKVYEECEVAAYERRGCKRTALHFRDCPDELARWLVDRGLDVDTRDYAGNTPLYWRVIWGGVDVLLELGADVNARNNYGYTPLHNAINRCPESVRQLIARGADMTSTYTSDLSSFRDVPPPLQYALQSCADVGIGALAGSARIMLDAGCPVPPNAAEQVTRIGRASEFIREGRPGTGARAADTDGAMAALYEMFGVRPVTPRRSHDGTAPITLTATGWRAQFSELWELLVPAGGGAPTRQGEVIRVAGRISHELLDNGGINWSRDHRRERDGLIKDLTSGTPVATREELSELARGITGDNFDDAAIHRLCELAVAWVLANPVPVRHDQSPVPQPPRKVSVESKHSQAAIPPEPATAPRNRPGWVGSIKAAARQRFRGDIDR